VKFHCCREFLLFDLLFSSVVDEVGQDDGRVDGDGGSVAVRVRLKRSTLKVIYIGIQQTGLPVWANFCTLGGYLLWAFLDIKLHGAISPTTNLSIKHFTVMLLCSDVVM
jgi:hypothetical protein